MKWTVCLPLYIDGVIFLHSSFVLLTTSGIKELRSLIMGNEPLVCFGLTEELCHLDTIAFSRQVQSDHRAGEGLDAFIQSHLEEHQTPKLTPSAAINMASIDGLQKKFLAMVDGYESDKNDGFDMPPQLKGLSILIIIAKLTNKLLAINNFALSHLFYFCSPVQVKTSNWIEFARVLDKTCVTSIIWLNIEGQVGQRCTMTI